MLIDRLRQALGDGKVLTDDATRRARRHDTWVLSELADVAGNGAPLPLCVVRPANVADVVHVVNVCRDTKTPLVPFGLGSGVCGAVLADERSVVIDLGGMNQVRRIDPKNLLAAFDAGVRGSDAEDTLGKQGLTLGHYPQSIGVSTVGGWIATRAAGQFSTGYGNVEDIVFSIEAVLPNGDVIETKNTPRASAGPDLRHFLLGSEGTLGVVTGVTFSCRRVPETRVVTAYHAGSMSAGFELQREIVQRGFSPVVLRLYDAAESTRMFSAFAKPDDALLLAVHEGPEEKVVAEELGVANIAKAFGAATAPAAATERWMNDRNHVPTLRSFLENGMAVDTIEVAATWDKILGIYERAVTSLGQVPGILAASAHSSHVYRSGINLYFTFAARPEKASDLGATYLDCWRRVMEATIAGGGGIAHHHGIGRVRREFLEREIGKTGVAALRALKRALDPVGFMNPGALLPQENP
jgi:alkyldihydroxyacetonephosphate synthase